MRFNIKNYIAFSLAEMMIVLLIVSVISAATIPTISTRFTSNKDSQKEIDGVSSTTDTILKELATSGIFYRNTSKTDKFVIGSDDSLKNSNDRTTLYSNMGSAMVVLEPLTSGTLANYGQIIMYQNTSLSTDNFNSYVKTGSIGIDTVSSATAPTYGNIRIGLDPQFAMFNGLQDSIFIGKLAGADINGAGLSGRINRTYLRNISIGSYASYNTAPVNSTLGGGYRPSHITDTVNIGKYAGLGLAYGISSVNIGSYAGGYADTNVKNKGLKTEGNINIGNFAGWNLVVTPADKKEIYDNVAIGYYAGSNAISPNTTSGSSFNSPNRRVNIGTFSGYLNPYANSVHIGKYAGALVASQKGTDFSSMVAIGNYAGALMVNTSVYNNGSAVLIGEYAGTNSSYLGNSVAIGVKSLYGSAPSSITWNGGSKLPIGEHMSVAIGNYAGMQGPHNNRSTDFGRYASTFIGYYSGYSVGKGFGNVAIGAYTMSTLSSKTNENYNNVFIGNYAGFSNTYASNTVIIGSQNNVDSSFYNSGHNVYDSVLIGDCPHMGSSSKVQYKSCIAVQSSDAGSRLDLSSKGVSGWTTSNTPTLFIFPGMPSSSGWSKTVITLYAGYVFNQFNTNLTAFSDKRLKENIKPTEYGIKDLRKINIYEFNMKNNKAQPRIGVIAQEIEPVFTRSVSIAPDGYLSVNAEDLFFTSVKAIKELDKTLSELINELKIQVMNLKSLVVKIDKLDDKIKQITISSIQADKKLKEIDTIISTMERK